MQRVLYAVRTLGDRHERRVRRLLPRFIAGLVAFGLVAANPPGASAFLASTSRSRASIAATGDDLLSSASVFLGSPEPGRGGVESSARAMVRAAGGLPVGPGQLGSWLRSGNALVEPGECAPGDVEISWVPPVGDYQVGAYVGPLGPVPTDATDRVNGVVVCRTSTYAFVGFEAAWDGSRWRLAAVPALAGEIDQPLLAGEATAEGATPAEASDAGPLALPPAAEWGATPLEPLAGDNPQTTCDPTAKVGVLGFRDLLLDTFPGSRNLGIGRACEAEGVSEHKEGRAFDWGVSADDPTELAAAQTQLAWLLGPDEAGEPYAIARRLGLMYVIWDRQIWSAFRAAEGWRPYVGVSPHRDHIHFSFDWPGALAETSFWRGGRARAGSNAPDLPLLTPAPRAAPTPGLPGALVPLPLPPPGVPNQAPIGPVGGSVGATVDDRSDPAPAPASKSASETSTTTSSTTSTTTTTTAPPTTTTTTAPIVTVPPPPAGPLGF